jgi:hypothetical protein
VETVDVIEDQGNDNDKNYEGERVHCESVVLDRNVLNNIGDILTTVRGGLEKFVDLFLSDELDRIFFIAEKVGEEVAFEFVGFILQSIDLDAEVYDGFLFVEGRQCLGEERAAAGNFLCKEENGGRDRLEPVRNDPESSVVNAVQNVVERGGEGLDVFGIERGDEGGTEAVEDIVDDVISFIFNAADVFLDPADSVVAIFEPGYEQVGGTAEDLTVTFKKLEESLVLW